MKQLIILTLLILLSLSSVCSSQESYLNEQEIDRLTLRTDLSEKEMDNLIWNIDRLCLESQTSDRHLYLLFNIRNQTKDSNYVNWDTLGMALIKGLEYRELYTNEVLLTKVLKYEISLWEEKSTNKDLVIDRLAIQLSKKPIYITTHDWYVTGTVAILSVILSVVLTLQLME